MKDPILETTFHAASAFEKRSLCGFEKLLRAGQKRFARVEKLQFFAESLVGIGPGKFRGLKFAGREVHESQANRRTGGMFCNGGKIIVFAGIENRAVRGRAGRDDPDDFPAHRSEERRVGKE